MPYEIVKNIYNNVDEIYNRLDEKYGKTSVLADLIMNQIKKIRTNEDGDDKRFIEYIDIVKKGYRDFSRMKVEYEISNATVLSIIKKKLPKAISRDWSKKINEDGRKMEELNKSPSLLKFLLKQKKILKYDSVDIRCGNSVALGQKPHQEKEDKKRKKI